MNYLSKKLCALALLFAIANAAAQDDNKKPTYWQYFIEGGKSFVVKCGKDLVATSYQTNSYTVDNGKKVYTKSKTDNHIENPTYILNQPISGCVTVNGELGKIYKKVEPIVTVTGNSGWKETGSTVFACDKDIPTQAATVQKVITATHFGWLNNTTQQVAAALVIAGLCIWQKDLIANTLKNIQIPQ